MIAHCGGADSGEVAAGDRFAVEQAHRDFVAQEAAHERALQFIAAEGQHGAGPQVGDVLTGSPCTGVGEHGFHHFGVVVGETPTEPFLGPAQGCPAVVDDEVAPHVAIEVGRPVLGDELGRLSDHCIETHTRTLRMR